MAVTQTAMQHIKAADEAPLHVGCHLVAKTATTLLPQIHTDISR